MLSCLPPTASTATAVCTCLWVSTPMTTFPIGSVCRILLTTVGFPSRNGGQRTGPSAGREDRTVTSA